MYAALDRGWAEPTRLRRTLTRLPVPRAADGRIVLAVDVSNWPSPDAPTSDERLFCHVYGRGDRRTDKLIPGWQYSFVAALETGRTSWCALLEAIRLGPADDATLVTADQLREVVGRLTAAGHWKLDDPEILIMMDSGCDVAYLAHALADLPVILVGRLRSDRVIAPRPRPAGTEGRTAPPPRRRSSLRPDRHLARARYQHRHGKARTMAWGRMHPRLAHRDPWLEYVEDELPIPRRTLVGLEVEFLPGGRGPLAAVLPAVLRPGTHLPSDEADPGLDRPEDPSRGHRRPVDLAHHRRPHPAPPRPAPRRRAETPLGTENRVPPAHPARVRRGFATSEPQQSIPQPHRNRPDQNRDALPARRTSTGPPVTASARQQNAPNQSLNTRKPQVNAKLRIGAHVTRSPAGSCPAGLRGVRASRGAAALRRTARTGGRRGSGRWC